MEVNDLNEFSDKTPEELLFSLGKSRGILTVLKVVLSSTIEKKPEVVNEESWSTNKLALEEATREFNATCSLLHLNNSIPVSYNANCFSEIDKKIITSYKRERSNIYLVADCLYSLLYFYHANIDYFLVKLLEVKNHLIKLLGFSGIPKAYLDYIALTFEKATNDEAYRTNNFEDDFKDILENIENFIVYGKEIPSTGLDIGADSTPEMPSLDALEQYSEIDDRFIVDKGSWVVSICRLPENGMHTQHAFLVLEGQENDRRKIWFIDLVYNRHEKLQKSQWIPGLQGQSKIRIFPAEKHVNDNLALLTRCSLRMMDTTTSPPIASVSWGLSSRKGLDLLKEVESDQKNPPKFHLMGRGNITSWGSSSEDGDSCFTWARRKLHNLQDKRIKIETDKFDEWVASLTSRRLIYHSTRYSIWKDPKVYVAATIGLVGSAAYLSNQVPECKMM